MQYLNELILLFIYIHIYILGHIYIIHLDSVLRFFAHISQINCVPYILFFTFYILNL